MITLKEAQERIQQEQEAIEKVFKKHGYEYHSSFSEEPEIKFWVRGEEGEDYELQGRYHCPAPCIDIDSEFFWQYEDEEGDIKDENSGTGVEELDKFLEKLHKDKE